MSAENNSSTGNELRGAKPSLRFDEYVYNRAQLQSRSQAQDLIKRGKVRLGTQIITKPAWRVYGQERIQILEKDLYVSRAGTKLASVSGELQLVFKDKIVLDIGSSTGGFTDFALQKGAKKVIAVDVGTDQLHPSLLSNRKIELHEQTDIRDFKLHKGESKPDIVVADVSFVSLTKILPAVKRLVSQKTQIVVMVKPQFEAEGYKLNDGVVKNNKQRREILSRFEDWLVYNKFVTKAKRDSGLAGATGNVERFYVLMLASS